MKEIMKANNGEANRKVAAWQWLASASKIMKASEKSSAKIINNEKHRGNRRGAQRKTSIIWRQHERALNKHAARVSSIARQRKRSPRARAASWQRHGARMAREVKMKSAK
jgi:hypothetical protein